MIVGGFLGVVGVVIWAESFGWRTNRAAFAGCGIGLALMACGGLLMAERI